MFMIPTQIHGMADWEVVYKDGHKGMSGGPVISLPLGHVVAIHRREGPTYFRSSKDYKGNKALLRATQEQFFFGLRVDLLVQDHIEGLKAFYQKLAESYRAMYNQNNTDLG